MALLLELFKQQNTETNEASSSALGFDELVKFSVGANQYAIPIRLVREVVEVLPISPFPQECDGMSGIVNIRGHIVPVITLFSTFFSPHSTRLLDRMVVVELSDNRWFCFQASNVQKILVPLGQFEDAAIINVNGNPTQCLAHDSLESIACRVKEEKSISKPRSTHGGI